MNIVFWIFQGLLALAFLFHGAQLIFQRERMQAQMKWVGDVPESLAIFIGIIEILGAIGLVVPALTGILMRFTPLAAAGLVLVMLLAIGFHLSRREYPNMGFNLILLLLAAAVAVGRFVVIPL
jgi:uncharacterized membrane protein YphA (DoxX/SURF4 family)